MSPFEKALVTETKRIRAVLAECDDFGSLHISIDVSGRVRDGDLKIEFRVWPPKPTDDEIPF